MMTTTVLLRVKLLAVFLVASPALKAQALNPTPAVAGVQSDINYLTSGYLRPLGEAVTAGLNNGWYHSAEAYPPGSFSVSLEPTVGLIPDAQTTFTIRPENLSELELVDPNDNVTPTAFGPDEAGVRLKYDNQSLPLGAGDREFNMPSGYGFQLLPLVNLSAAVGLPGHNTLRLRYLPSVSVPALDSTDYQLFGLGLQHNLTEWIPGLSALPLNISLLGGYSQFSLEQALPGNNNQQQALKLTTQSWTGRLLVSKEISFLTLYGGIGYNGGNTRIQMKGTYRWVDPLDFNDPEKTIEDPVDFTTTGSNGIYGNLGLRLEFLKVIFFAADYTLGPYPAVSASLGTQIKL